MSEQFTQPFTPCELSAPSPRIFRAMNARLELLLLKHYPEVFPAWVKSMEARGKGRTVFLYWGQTLAYLAAALPIDKPGGYWPEKRSARDEKRMERNLTLLLRLVLKGCRRRGEFLSKRGEFQTPAEREERLRFREAVYREQYGDDAYHRLITEGEEQDQQQQEAA